MEHERQKITVRFEDGRAALTIGKDDIFLGRMRSCDILLDHPSVSRIHAGINFLESAYFVINLSSSNVMTLNGRLLAPKATDVLSEGDIIQIGPFVIRVQGIEDGLALSVYRQSISDLQTRRSDVPQQVAGGIEPDRANVLKVFWEKRTREKEDWGTLLRPTEKPRPGKAVANWKPTRDLQRPWRVGLFAWAFLVIGVIGVLAFLRYPQAYAGKPLSNAHAEDLPASGIALTSNGNSCTTCHAPDEPIENACIKCHQAEQFHASNTRAHEQAGITCVGCHREHQGAAFNMKTAALQTCAECHSDNNKELYSGHPVRTPHGGSFGYPVENGKWIWSGLHAEIAETIPAVRASAVKDESEQKRRSREFHVIHVARLNAPEGMPADAGGLVSCSTCHKSFDPIDTITPRQTCAACHNTPVEDRVNCVSCHVQHPYASDRWDTSLGNEAVAHRRNVIANQIKRLNEK